jgi:hypothetical protein
MPFNSTLTTALLELSLFAIEILVGQCFVTSAGSRFENIGSARL